MKDLIAAKLKILRNKNGYSAEKVVSELKNMGTTLSTVTLYGYENGVSQPKADTFLQLCKIYNVENFDIFFNDDVNVSSKSLYDTLNPAGKARADEYIEDLAGNPKYTERQKTIAEDIVEELTQNAKVPTNTK